MPKLKRVDVVPGARLRVKREGVLGLEPASKQERYLIAYGRAGEALPSLVVLTLPRKVRHTNLVRVRVKRREYEALYCDVLGQCELVEPWEPVERPSAWERLA